MLKMDECKKSLWMFTLGCFRMNFNNQDWKTTNIQLTTKKDQNHLLSDDWGDLVSAVRSSIKTEKNNSKKKKEKKQRKGNSFEWSTVYVTNLCKWLLSIWCTPSAAWGVNNQKQNQECICSVFNRTSWVFFGLVVLNLWTEQLVTSSADQPNPIKYWHWKYIVFPDIHTLCSWFVFLSPSKTVWYWSSNTLSNVTYSSCLCIIAQCVPGDMPSVKLTLLVRVTRDPFGSWTKWSLKIHSNPNHLMFLSKQNQGIQSTESRIWDLFLGWQHQHLHLIWAGRLKFICGKGSCLTRFNDHSVYFLKVSMVNSGYSFVCLFWFQMLLQSSVFRHKHLFPLISVDLKKSLSYALMVQRFILQIIWGKNCIFLGVCNIWGLWGP